MKHLFFVILLGLVLLTGCAPNRRTIQPVSVPSLTTPAAATVQQPQASPLPEVTWTVAEPIKEPQQKSARRERKRTPTMGKGGKTIIYEPGGWYDLHCSEFGAVNVVLPVGERLLDINSGATGEWKAVPSNMGSTESIVVVAVSRTPTAPTAEIHFITDGPAIYQFIAHPATGGVTKGKKSLIQIVNPETEARRIERAEARAAEAERHRREQAERVPQAEFSLLGRGK